MNDLSHILSSNSKTSRKDIKDISIVMVNYNSGGLLSKSLQSIFNSGCDSNTEVIVVDNNSDDNSAQNARAIFPQVNFIQNDRNLGFAKANNLGIKKSQGRSVLLLNPDTVIVHGALQKMVEFMNTSPKIGIIGAKLLNPDGNVQLSCRSFPSWINAIYNRYSPITRMFPKNKHAAGYLLTDWAHDEPRQVDWLSGACLMIKREVLEQIGLFDEDFFMYCEDIDICYRSKQAGWKNFYYPDAQVMHYIGCGKKKVSFKSIIFHHISMYKFFRKHYCKNRIVFNILTFCGIMISFIMTSIYKRRIREGNSK